MTVNKVNNGGTLTAAISGRVDTTTAPVLEAELKGSFEGCEALVLDFAKVEYISSAGLRVLLSSQKTMTKKGGTMKLVNVSDDIMEIFEVTGFTDILTIE
jgi:anti-sigma B factor antagonist